MRLPAVPRPVYASVAPSRPTPPPKSEAGEWSAAIATEFAVGGSKYGLDKAVGFALEASSYNALADQPLVDLHRPLLLVHGFLGHGRQFGTLAEHLTAEGRNGGNPVYVKDGDFYSDPECEQPCQATQANKVFYMVHPPESAPEAIADSMELAAAAIGRLSGMADLDVAAHSLGGIAARIYCDRGHKLSKLAMVGTPNQGSRAALLTGAALANQIAWATSLANVTAAGAAALNWMVPTVNGNQKLQDLNARWSQQQQNMGDVIAVGAKDFVTPHPAEAWGSGDGLIEEQSLGVGNVKVQTLEGHGRKAHYHLMNDPDMFSSLTQFFGW